MSSYDGLRVLVVDDEQTVADTLALILKASGHTVRAVYSAEEGAVLAESFQPHAVISDLMLPGMNGIEMANYFAEHFPECKVLLVSGYTSVFAEFHVPMGQGRRRCSILPKPVQPADILAFIANCSA